MSEIVCCTNPNCKKEFEYEEEILTGSTKGIDKENKMGASKGIFSSPKKPKKQNTLLECPHCKREDYYKVLVSG
jgi:hypothetical protein